MDEQLSGVQSRVSAKVVDEASNPVETMSEMNLCVLDSLGLYIYN